MENRTFKEILNKLLLTGSVNDVGLDQKSKSQHTNQLLEQR